MVCGTTLVWDHALSDEGIRNTVTALRYKWDVKSLPDPHAGNTTVENHSTVIPFSMPPTVLPVTLPAPVLWLDAAHDSSLRTDIAGMLPTVENGRIRVWLDRSGSGYHVTFPEGTAEWLTGSRERLNGHPLVQSMGGAGSFATSSGPLVGCSAYTVVAVWQIVSNGAHPVSVNGHGQFDPGAWRESLGVDVELSTDLPIPSTLGLVSNTAVVASWEGDIVDGSMSWRLMAVEDNAGGHRFEAEKSKGTAWLNGITTVGQTGRLLRLGELLMWRSKLDPSHRTDLATYIRQKWGEALLPRSGGISHSIVIPRNSVFVAGSFIQDNSQGWTASDVTRLRGVGNTPVVDGQTVAQWYDTDGNVAMTPPPSTTMSARYVANVNGSGKAGVYGPMRTPGGTAYSLFNRCVFVVFSLSRSNSYYNTYLLSRSLGWDFSFFAIQSGLVNVPGNSVGFQMYSVPYVTFATPNNGMVLVMGFQAKPLTVDNNNNILSITIDSVGPSTHTVSSNSFNGGYNQENDSFPLDLNYQYEARERDQESTILDLRLFHGTLGTNQMQSVYDELRAAYA